MSTKRFETVKGCTPRELIDMANDESHMSISEQTVKAISQT
jgi:hypothetical protein